MDERAEGGKGGQVLTRSNSFKFPFIVQTHLDDFCQGSKTQKSSPCQQLYYNFSMGKQTKDGIFLPSLTASSQK